MIPDGCENCDNIAEIKVAQKIIFQQPNTSVAKTTKTETGLKISHQIIVLFSRQRSANVPPIKEKIKIGANSVTEIIETVKASPFVLSMINNNTAKFQTHILFKGTRQKD